MNMRTYLIFGVMALLLLGIALAADYVAPSYDNVVLVLKPHPTSSYQSITLILNEDASNATDPCAAPAINTNWLLSCSSNCTLTGQNINLGNGNFTLSGSGTFRLENTNMSVKRYIRSYTNCKFAIGAGSRFIRG